MFYSIWNVNNWIENTISKNNNEKFASYKLVIASLDICEAIFEKWLLV